MDDFKKQAVTVRAAVNTEYGSPEKVLQVKEVAKPVPGSSDVLIKVHATTVNRTDCGFLTAEYFIIRFFTGFFRPKYPTLGCEFAGEIEAIGKGVKSFKVGERVFGFNDVRFGAHAEYMLFPEDGAIGIIPPGLSFRDAAPITEAAHYALCDIRAAKIQSGQNILINGATGGIGSAAVQLAKYLGATVTAVCGTKHIALVKSLGADVVVDYMKEDFTKLNQTFDVVFDAVGKSTFGKCRTLLKRTGVYMSTELGPMSQNPFLALVTPLLGGKKVLFPLPRITKDDVNFLGKLVETGRFKPVIDRYYPLEQIVDAYKYVLTGQKIGNVVINIAQEGKSSG